MRVARGPCRNDVPPNPIRTEAARSRAPPQPNETRDQLDFPKLEAKYGGRRRLTQLVVGCYSSNDLARWWRPTSTSSPSCPQTCFQLTAFLLDTDSRFVL